MKITAFDLAQRYIGLAEVAGASANPAVLAMLKLDQDWPQDDEVAWCGAFVNWVCWHLRLPRSKDLRARSWLRVGAGVPLVEARTGWDVVVLKRGQGEQPGPSVIDAPGHVGFFAGLEPGQESDRILVLGGNQGDAVNVTPYHATRLLGVRRLRHEGGC